MSDPKQSSDSGNGWIGGRPMFWDRDPDGGMHLFPGGLPRGRNEDFPHDHIYVNPDGGVEFMRENGQIINNYRDWHGNK